MQRHLLPQFKKRWRELLCHACCVSRFSEKNRWMSFPLRLGIRNYMFTASYCKKWDEPHALLQMMQEFSNIADCVLSCCESLSLNVHGWHAQRKLKDAWVATIFASCISFIFMAKRKQCCLLNCTRIAWLPLTSAAPWKAYVTSAARGILLKNILAVGKLHTLTYAAKMARPPIFLKFRRRPMC